MFQERAIIVMVGLCILTLCVGEIYAMAGGKPHSELFDAVLGSLIGYVVGRSFREKSESRPKPKSKASKK